MDLNCPYCNAELEVHRDDDFGYEVGVEHEMECSKCNKLFIFKTSISFYYKARKADCLNGAEHNYKKVATFPEGFSKMKCEVCGAEREFTDEERVKFGIGTKESYFERIK